jgi:Arc/MetJ-type ribon-helix-helix transcriptional regulator
MPPSRTLGLPEDVIRFAEAQVAAGRFATVDDVIRAGVEALKAREEAEHEWLAYARGKWRDGVAASDGGQATEMTSAEFSAWLDGCLADASRH